MREKSLMLLAALIFLTTAVTGCNSREPGVSAAKTSASTAQPAKTTDEPKSITVADARAAFDEGRAVIIDVRAEPSYKAGHIKGSKLITVNDIGARAAELPKDKTIILYCSCSAEQSSITAARALKGKGVENTAVLVGGYNAWKEAGNPVETSN